MPTLSEEMIYATQHLAQAVEHLLKSGILDAHTARTTMIRGDLAQGIFDGYMKWQNASCHPSACEDWTLSLPQSSQALFQSIDLTFTFDQARVDELKNKDCLVILFEPDDILRMERALEEWKFLHQLQPLPQKRKLKI